MTDETAREKEIRVAAREGREGGTKRRVGGRQGLEWGGEFTPRPADLEKIGMYRGKGAVITSQNKI